MSEESSKAKMTPAIPDGKFAARLTPENVKYLLLIGETEDISLNEALNRILHRQRFYPKDMAEIHAELQYMIGELEVVQSQLDLCALHEEHLIELLDTGWIEQKLEEQRDLKEARIRAAIAGGEIE